MKDDLIVAVLVPAAGQGRRMGGETAKQFRALDGVPLLVRTLRVFERHPAVRHLVVALPKQQHRGAGLELERAGLTKLAQVVPGGETRQDSVAAALRAVPDGVDVVLVHDAVRPFVEGHHVQAVIDAAAEVGAAALAVPVADTLRRIDDGAFAGTVSREDLYRMQTPQGFRLDLFRQAHAQARTRGYQATDDVDLVQQLGHPVRVVTGSARNIKLTTAEDWELAEHLWALQRDDE